MGKLDLFQEGSVDSTFFQQSIDINQHVDRLKMKIYIDAEKT